MTIRVAVVDDQILFTETLKILLAADPGIEVVGVLSSGPELLRLVRAQPVDVILVDVDMPGMSGLDTVRALARIPRAAAARIIMLTVVTAPGVVRAALALPLKMRRHPYLNKPMLYRAMRGLMPREIFARATKGEYSQDSYETLYARREHLVGDLADGAVADLGLIDRKALKSKLSMQALSSEFLFELKRLVAAERWIRSVR